MDTPNGVFTLRTVVALAVLLITGASMARADGKVFAPVLVPQQVEMPDQRALLAWKNGVETLVIESAFVGKGTDFAWVVPLPSKPEVFPATNGTLPAAVALMQPTVASHFPAEAWAAAIILGGIGLVALAFGWSMVGKLIRVFIVLGGVAVLALILGALTRSEMIAWLAMGAGCLSAWPLRNWFKQETTMSEVLVGLLIVAVLAGMMIPTFGTAGSTIQGVSISGSVTVERQQVGDYDVTLIAGREGDGVVAWLKENGFQLGDAAQKVATEQAKAGGWFVASRVRRTFAESGRSVPAPLAFRFATEQAIYPMRFTGAGAERALAVELVVFGPGRAEVPGLATRSVAPLTHGEPEAQKGWRGGLESRDERRISHPELTRWTEGTEVATWVRGELSVAQMQEDLSIRWTQNSQPMGLYALAVEDAWMQAALLGGSICFIGAIGLGLVFKKGAPAVRWSGTVTLVALASASILRVLTPTVAVERQQGLGRWSDLRQVVQVAAMTLSDLPRDASNDTVQAEFTKALGNFFKPMRIGDAPGEVMLHKLPDGNWRMWFFDAYGQPRFFEGHDIGLASGAKVSS